MLLRNTSILRPIIAVLAIAMLAVALACASEEPTSEPLVQATPTTSAAATPLTVGQPTATPVSDGTMADLTWINRYLQSPGYDPEWGEPKTGGTYVFGAQLDVSRFTPAEQGCCYYHGCYRGLPWNSLFRIDPWTGILAL